MLVALERFDLRIPGCRSLKEKRHVVKALTNGLRATFNVSVAEVDHHDLWQRCGLAVATVAGEPFHVRRVIAEVERFVERFGGVELIDRQVSFHGPDD
jgi:uncharacterized protein YlxP (DUF503 family)